MEVDVRATWAACFDGRNFLVGLGFRVGMGLDVFMQGLRAYAELLLGSAWLMHGFK